ncbi:MAG: LamG-like jellyroll fold domain-containing protein [Desulfobaccales bacterium]
MANGKIIYTPPETRALSLDGLHFLSRDDAALNMGVQDFNLDFLIKVDPTITDPFVRLVSKATVSLAGAAGWIVQLDTANRKLGLILNDGEVSPVTVETEANALPEHGNWFYGGISADRSGQVRFYIAGADAGGGEVSSRPGSLDNSELFRVGAYSAASYRFDGLIGFVRLDVGRVLPAAWWAAEWDRLRYGCLRELADSLELWQFYDSLAGDGGLDLDWQGGDTPAYADGWPSIIAPLAYTFEENFQRKFEFGHLDFTDRQRAEDGSAFSHAGAIKRYFRLPFKNMPFTQQAALTAAWQGQQDLELFLDAGRRRTCWALIKEAPVMNQQLQERAEGDLSLEET